MWHNLTVWFIDQAHNNNIFSGVIGAGLLTTILYVLKRWGLNLLVKIRGLFVITIRVLNTDDAFADIITWLAQTSYVKNRCRRFSLTAQHNDKDTNNFTLAPGLGTHYFLFKGRLFMLHRDIKEAGGTYGKSLETLHLSVFAFRRNILHDFLTAVKEITQATNTAHTYMWQNWWQRSFSRAPRPVGTVFFNNREDENVCADAQWFLRSKEWYRARGIPYRRGYLFSGPPGTGKTTMAMVLADTLKKSIAVLDVRGCSSDASLLEAITRVPANCILLIEDIDTLNITNKRIKSKPKCGTGEAVTETDPPVKEDEGVSLSGLLNALDGVTYRSGSIVVMTTNHPENLDAALIRPGRVDYHATFSLAEQKCAYDMFLAFFREHPNAPALATAFLRLYKLPAPQAELQGLFIKHKDDPVKLIQTLKEE